MANNGFSLEWNKNIETETIELIKTLNKNELKLLLEAASEYTRRVMTWDQLQKSLNISKIQNKLQIKQCLNLVCNIITCYLRNNEDSFKAIMADIGFSNNLTDIIYPILKTNVVKFKNDLPQKPSLILEKPDISYVIDISTFDQQKTRKPRGILLDINLIGNNSEDSNNKLLMDMNSYHQLRCELSQLLLYLEKNKK